MKALFVLPCLILASCVSRRTPDIKVTPPRTPLVDQVESFRIGETVRVYHVGRYADPNYPDVMHLEHPVYRIETHGRWNLKPGHSMPRTTNTFGRPTDAAFSPAPTNDVVLAELNRQKEATERVVEGASRLGRSYDQLQKALSEMSLLVKSHLSITSRLSATEQRVELFEKELQQRAQAPVAATNEVSFPSVMKSEAAPE